jgi:hypothetical protein
LKYVIFSAEQRKHHDQRQSQIATSHRPQDRLALRLCDWCVRSSRKVLGVLFSSCAHCPARQHVRSHIRRGPTRCGGSSGRVRPVVVGLLRDSRLPKPAGPSSAANPSSTLIGVKRIRGSPAVRTRGRSPEPSTPITPRCLGCAPHPDPRLNSLPCSPGLVGSLPSRSRPPTLGCLPSSLVLGLVDGGRPSPQERGLSGVSGELWDVPLLTGEGPGRFWAAADSVLQTISAPANRHRPIMIHSCAMHHLDGLGSLRVARYCQIGSQDPVRNTQPEAGCASGHDVRRGFLSGSSECTSR